MISLVDKPNPLKPDVLTSIMSPHAVENYSYKVCEENLKIGKMFVTLEIDLIQENGIPVVVKSKGIPIEKDSNVESLKSIKFSKPDLIFALIENQVTNSN